MEETTELDIASEIWQEKHIHKYTSQMEKLKEESGVFNPWTWKHKELHLTLYSSPSKPENA